MKQLVKETPIGFWVYDVKKSLFRKRPIVLSGGTQGDYKLVGIQRRWADGETLTVEDIIEPICDPQEFLDAGKAVFDHRSRVMLMPGDAFPPLVTT